MTELDSVKALRGVLSTHLNCHGARLEFLARVIGLDLLQRLVAQRESFGAQFLHLLGFLLDGQPLSLHPSIACES